MDSPAEKMEETSKCGVCGGDWRGSEHYSGPGHNPLLYEDGAISELFRDMETDRDLSST